MLKRFIPQCFVIFINFNKHYLPLSNESRENIQPYFFLYNCHRTILHSVFFLFCDRLSSTIKLTQYIFPKLLADSKYNKLQVANFYQYLDYCLHSYIHNDASFGLFLGVSCWTWESTQNFVPNPYEGNSVNHDRVQELNYKYSWVFICSWDWICKLSMISTSKYFSTKPCTIRTWEYSILLVSNIGIKHLAGFENENIISFRVETCE